MPEEMAIDLLRDMPGGDDFVDVTELFAEAGRDMEPEDVLLVDGYTLMDAMGAFEIGEPRMDSGMILQEQRKPPFDALAPLLPQEVCWIIDRSFSCEMEWHAGSTLAQTVYTLLYIHHLKDIDPDTLMPEVTPDPLRPRGLISIVLRASVLGLLKSCDLAWRELSKNKVYEIEDWQGEKCEVSLLEGITTEFIIQKLDTALNWLRKSVLPISYVLALSDRLLLRKAILQLLKLNPARTSELRLLISTAREALNRIRAHPVEPPSSDSLAYLTFDPYITRRLPNFMPMRVLELPPQGETWNAIENLFEDWEELCLLLDTPCITTWVIAGTLHIWSPREQPQCAYIRSLTQSAFFDKSALGRYPPAWLVDRFFSEMLGISYAMIQQLYQKRITYGEPAVPSINEIERQITKLTLPHVRSQWSNPPRRRRHLMKSVLEWHDLYAAIVELTSQIMPANDEDVKLISRITQAALLRRLAASREIILSGFQQELYAADERSIAYWYLAKTIDVHLTCLDDLLQTISQDFLGWPEMLFQFDFLSALHIMSIAMCALTSRQVVTSFRRMSLNFVKRYKWLFRSEFDDLVPVDPSPDFYNYSPEVTELTQDPYYSPSESFKLAGNVLRGLCRATYVVGWADKWANERRDFVLRLAGVAERLEAAPTNNEDLTTFDHKVLRWDPQYHPWFPDMASGDA
ncbi:Mak10-domain-containing protein [Sparassis crispa]|uniref:Mak10-domain-containing protein n=1 Tax=Sparassis crispa TaxID=139825 RepID=A0A401GKZ9_9APHY|nr:Mak10-domain-containing protein [Sparassis crispa]GBE82822.1 Mak10-domain-containing protein [Sparassis crispa]